jgi:hypothetical protein
MASRYTVLVEDDAALARLKQVPGVTLVPAPTNHNASVFVIRRKSDSAYLRASGTFTFDKVSARWFTTYTAASHELNRLHFLPEFHDILPLLEA